MSDVRIKSLMKFDVSKIMTNLSNKDYPLFVSERHFQIAFIIEAKKEYSEYVFLPEFSYQDGKTYRVDLIVTDGSEYIAFEFKYVVDKVAIRIPANMNYVLKNQKATNIRRYQCVKDISRLEHYLKTSDISIKKGYLILLTNMAKLWNGCKTNATDYNFDIKDNSLLTSGPHSPTGKTKFAETHPVINIERTRSLQYNYFFNIGNSKNSLFRTLVVKVD